MVPKLRFRAFSEEYNIRKLKETADIITGSTPSTSNSNFYGGEYMFVSPVDINEEKFVSHTKTTVSKEGVISGREIPAYSVMFVCIGSTIGKLAINSCPCITNQQINSLICNTYFSANYLYSILEKHSKKIKELAGIQAVPLINKTTFSNVELYFPNIEEQTKVATFISSVDEKITLLNKQYNLLCQYKKGMMQKVFSQELRFKYDNGKDFPQWRLKKIREITSLIKDGTHGTHNNVTESDFLLLSAKNIQDGKVVVDSKDRKISEIEFRAIIKNYKLAPGDILLSIVGTIGRVAIYSKQYANYAFQRSVAFFRFPQEQPEFIYQLFNSSKFQKELIIRQVISAQPGIYLGDLADISLEIPVQKEQMRIANFLSALDAKIAAKKAELDKLKTWKQGLLQQMFV